MAIDVGAEGKEAAGVQAAAEVEPGMVLGLGTGSTVAYYLRALGRRFKDGELPGIVGVPTSVRTEREAESLGLPLTTLEEAGAIDLTVDGADEVDPSLDLIKGMGGALLREKMVAQATKTMLVIVDERKVVDQLGTRSPLPVEVTPFAWKSHLPFLMELDAEPALRRNPDGAPYTTDNGNFLLECTFPAGIPDVKELDRLLASRAGIVESGLFLSLAKKVLVGGDGGVRSLTREGTP